MFSANKITGMTVVLSETLKEIITKNDVAQDAHPYSIHNCKNKNIKYVALKPWEHVEKGQKPPDAGLYPGSGYTGAREVHGASFQSSLKLAQRSTLSKTIKEGEHYVDGGHFKTSAELGSLAGGQQASMPPSARGTPMTAREKRLEERKTARGQRTPTNQMEPLAPDAPELGNESRRSTARSNRSARSNDSARSRRSAGGGGGGMAGSIQNSQENVVRNMFDQLPPERKEAILQELSTGWLQSEAAGVDQPSDA